MKLLERAAFGAMGAVALGSPALAFPSLGAGASGLRGTPFLDPAPFQWYLR